MASVPSPLRGAGMGAFSTVACYVRPWLWRSELRGPRAVPLPTSAGGFITLLFQRGLWTLDIIQRCSAVRLFRFLPFLPASRRPSVTLPGSLSLINHLSFPSSALLFCWLTAPSEIIMHWNSSPPPSPCLSLSLSVIAPFCFYICFSSVSLCLTRACEYGCCAQFW